MVPTVQSGSINPHKNALLEMEFHKLLQKGAIEFPEDKSSPQFYSLDLKDAYLQFPIHQRSRKYLLMEFKGTIYQFTSLPFGISTAPWLFTRVAGVVKELFHKDRLSLF